MVEILKLGETIQNAMSNLAIKHQKVWGNLGFGWLQNIWESLEVIDKFYFIFSYLSHYLDVFLGVRLEEDFFHGNKFSSIILLLDLSFFKIKETE